MNEIAGGQGLVNCRDLDGRHSTPLHFAAGYNRLCVVEYLLQHGADVQAKVRSASNSVPTSKSLLLWIPHWFESYCSVIARLSASF